MGRKPSENVRSRLAAWALIGLALAAGPARAAGDAVPAPLAAIPSVAPLVRSVLPAVVTVTAAPKPGVLPLDDADADPRGGPGPDTLSSPFEDLLRRFVEPRQPRGDQGLFASGFVIDPAGYIVTNDHVVATADRVTVTFQDGTQLPAQTVGRDTPTDLALLKVDAGRPMPAVSWGDSDRAQVGDWVLAVGNPFGLGGTISSGIISARGRDIHSGPFDDFLQIDASINRGNSGGPTFGLDGRVIGITTAIFTPSGGSVGIAFAIPANLARPLIEQLRSIGRVRRGWLGVQLQEVTPEIARGLRLTQPGGALIAGVTDGGPAARAGLRPGDVVLGFDGRLIRKVVELTLGVAASPPGRTATVLVWRNGREVTVSPRIEEMPERLGAGGKDSGAPARPSDRTGAILGLTLAPLTPEWRQWFQIPAAVTGVLVMAISDDSPLGGLDLDRGDVIVAVDQQPVTTPQDAVARLRAAARRAGGGALMLINRGGTGKFVVLPPVASPVAGEIGGD